MKKFFLLVPVAALALTACTSESNEFVGDKQQQAREIKFSPLAQNLTRAAGDAEYNAVEGTTYPQNYNMKVVAYSVPETGSAGNYFGSATADGGILFCYQYAGGLSAPGTNANYWGGSPAQYWPLSKATLNFLAVSKGGSPTADVVSPQFNANYASGVTVTLSDNKPASALVGTGQHDLMYGFGRAEVDKSDNALTFDPKVDIEFKHALAWVIFRVKAGNQPSEAISIKDIKLNGARYDGTFVAAVDNYNSSSADLGWNAAGTKWTAAGDAQNAVSTPNFSSAYNTDGDGAGGDDSKALDDAAFYTVGDGILVVPTSELTSTVSMTSFDIEYYLNGNLYTYNYAPTTNAEKTFAKGKKYIFDITMTLHEIFVNPSVVDWEDGGTNYIDIPTFTAGTTGRTFNIPATAGTYIFRVAGFSGASTPVATGTLTETITTATVTVTDYTSGVATVKVTVPANTGSETGGTIILTDMGDGANASNNTTVTVTQAAP